VFPERGWRLSYYSIQNICLYALPLPELSNYVFLSYFRCILKFCSSFLIVPKLVSHLGQIFFYIRLNYIFFGTDIFAVNDYQIGGNEGEKERCWAVDVSSITPWQPERKNQTTWAVQMARNQRCWWRQFDPRSSKGFEKGY